MDDRIKAAFGRIWPAHVSNLAEFLIACRRAFKGDIDMFLVLTVIGDRTFSQRHADPDLDYEAFKAGAAQSTTSLDINLRSIADFSGIPRETVRRKINQLVELGWVAKQPDGSLRATSKAKTELEPLTLASIQYISEMMQLFSETFETPENASDPKRPTRTPKAPRTRMRQTAS